MQTLIKFKQFVDEINLENGRNYKISVLEKYKDNDCIKYFLQQVYDPFIVFGISEKKLYKDVGFQSGTMWLDYPEDSEIFEYLKAHNTGTDRDIWTVQQYKKSQIPEDCTDLFDKIITKNLILGISGDTINKVFGKDTIRKFSVMLANKYFDKPEVVNGKEFVLTTKIDGCRIVAIKENGEVSFYTRQGQKYEGLVDLEKEMKEFMPDNIALDGELTLLDKGDLDSGAQYKETTKLCRTKDLEKHGLKMLVFDAMRSEQFRNQSCDTPYYKRRAFLEKQFANTNPECYSCAAAGRHAFVYFNLLPVLYQGSDTTMIENILHKQVEKGEEGIMINIVDAPYQFKRTNDLLKCKLFNDLDLEVVGFEEGTNSNKGRLGALICQYSENTVKVGSGFTEELRNEIWTNKDEWLGRTVVVKYFEESVDSKTGLKSLRFPIYIDWRNDK